MVVGDVDDARGPGYRRGARRPLRHCDVTDAEQVEGLFEAAYTTYGSVDVAFNNAGISPPDDDSILDTGIEAWRRVQEVNLTSVYLCCKAALPYMREQGRGSIINTASFVAVMGAATSQISYTASKGGVLAMSRELGVQFAREGIRVNALCPGPVNTPLLQELFAKDPERAARRLVHIPLGRFAEPEEIASAVLFLASDDASFITASHVPGRRRNLRRVRHPAVRRSPCRVPDRSSASRRTSSLQAGAPGGRCPRRWFRYAYVAQVSAAGGIPVVLPPLPGEATEADARALLALLDGLLLAGGADVDAARYGQRPHPTVQAVRPERDASELLLAGVTAEEDVPVARCLPGHAGDGGRRRRSADQHLPDLLGTTCTRRGVAAYGSHVITVKENTRLYEILGSTGDRRDVPPPGGCGRGGVPAECVGGRRCVEALEDQGRRSSSARAAAAGHAGEPATTRGCSRRPVAAAANRRAGRHRGADPL